MNKITSVALRERKPLSFHFSCIFHKKNSSFLSPSTAFFTLYTMENHYYHIPSLFERKMSIVRSFERKMSIVSSVKGKLNGFISDNIKAKTGACLAFEKIADDIDYYEFFQHFELEDTFQSWFLALQLHVWMTISATMGGTKSKLFKMTLIDSMWNDVELRMEKLATMKSSTRKKYLKDLVMEFQACLVSYDEGIFSEDTVLAAAAWRMLFACKPVHPQLLEHAVCYIRKQLAHLESQNIQEIIFRGSVSFLPLKTILSSNEI